MPPVHMRSNQPSSSPESVHDSGLASASSSTTTSIEAWLEQTTATRDNPRKRKLGDTFIPYEMVDAGHKGSLVGHLRPHPSSPMSVLADQAEAPKTPSQSVAGSDPRPPSTIDSKSTQSTDPKYPTDPLWIEHRLRSHKMWQNKDGVLEKYSDFQKQVRKIIERSRDSTVNPASAKKFEQKHRYYERANEDTFLRNVLPTIIKSSRTVKRRVHNDVLKSNEGVQNLEKTQEEPEESSQQYSEEVNATVTYEQAGGEERQSTAQRLAEEESGYTVLDFWDDGLAVTLNCELRRGFLPGANKDEDLAKAMAEVDGMTNPKPDYTYGVRFDHHQIPDDVTVSPNVDVLLEVAPILHHPFYIIEGKSDSGSRAEAENQVCHGGATLVNAARQLREKVYTQVEEKRGPDLHTFVYSAVVSPGLMDIWIHWAEVRTPASTLFHMHRLESVSMNSPGAAGKLRSITHNILDWGCAGRSSQIRAVYDQIFAYERACQEEKRKKLAGKALGKKRKTNDGSVWS